MLEDISNSWDFSDIFKYNVVQGYFEFVPEWLEGNSTSLIGTASNLPSSLFALVELQLKIGSKSSVGN